jgi:hypothetical protein
MPENLKQTTDTSLQLREQIKANYEEINNSNSVKSEQELAANICNAKKGR